MRVWRWLCVGLVWLCATSLPAHAMGVWHVDLAAAGGSRVDLRLHNAGQATAWVLISGSILDPNLPEDVFSVQRRTDSGDVPVAYTGPVVKRALPAVSDYLAVAPGGVVTTQVDLSSLYDIGSSALYRVQLQQHLLYRLDAPTATPAADSLPTHEQMLYSAPVDISMVANTVSARLAQPAFGQCSVAQQADILIAGELAQRYVDTAVSDISSLALAERSQSPRYAQWFGEYNRDRFESVEQNFRNIQKVLQQDTLRFDCGCDFEGVYAYVQTDDPYNIYLCPVFWQASAGGTDSQAGTLVHELSHFEVIAGTADHVYGQSGAIALASSNPGLAVQNADSHEYFAENSPAVEIAAPDAQIPAGADFTVLMADDEITAALIAGERHYYTVTDVTRFLLSPALGDVDLYVYDDDQLGDLVCASANRGTTLDRCAPAESGTFFVEVRALSDSEYRLATETESVGADLPLLTVGQLQLAMLAQGETATFKVDAATEIVFTPLSGAGNLFVLADPDDLSSVVCAATGSAGVARCELGNAYNVLFPYLVAVTDTQFTVEAVQSRVVAAGGMDVSGVGLGATGPMSLVLFGWLLAVCQWLRSTSRWPMFTLSRGLVIGTCLVALSACSQPPVVVQSHNAAVSKGRVSGLVARLEESERGTSWVLFSLENHSDETLTVPIWGTPLESPILGDYFEVKHGDIALIYRGPMAKRSLEGSPLVELSPGESVSVDIDLAAQYKLRKGKNAKVRFKSQNQNGQHWLRQGVSLNASVGEVRRFVQ